MATTDREADLEVVLAEVYAILKPLATEGTHGASSPILKAWAVLDAQDWADVVAAHDKRVRAEAWDECYSTAYSDTGNILRDPNNPYRRE